MLALAVLAAPLCAHAQHGMAEGTLSGIIRDADGIPQMGALVQALLPDATPLASAITDSQGRYRFSLRPGSYRIQATAALFTPAFREHLQIGRGTRAIADFTLGTLLAPTGWLPVTRRAADEPSDDWMWTLRSSASRPILRFQDPQDQTGTNVALSSSRAEARRGTSGGRLVLKASEGGFAGGGAHNILVLTRVGEDGSGTILRVDLSGPRTPYPVAPSADLSIGFERRMLLGGYMRSVLTYSSHPELTDRRGLPGVQAATLRSGERIELGDTFRIDAGSVLRDANFGGNAIQLEPFLKVSAKPTTGVIIAYAITRSRGTTSLDDFDRVQSSLPTGVIQNGHLKLETGSHQELTLISNAGRGATVEATVYRDHMRNPLLTGTGSLAPADMQMDGLIADPTTETFRVASRDFDSSGLQVVLREPVTRSIAVSAKFQTGQALRAKRIANASMQDFIASVEPSALYAAVLAGDGRIARTGTSFRGSYRWQPARTLTAVDSYQSVDDSAFLSCSLRQTLRLAHLLPQSLQAVVDVQNLLAEGYVPFLSRDGKTPYFAQAPRSLQAGLSFTF